MSLIKCSECNSEVSDKAVSCPKCGAPILNDSESKGSGVNLRTVQETSKKFKLQSLISISLFIIGAVWVYVSMNTVTGQVTEPSNTGMSVMLIGMIWYIINRLRIWWHHK